jgi:hypothetical protein
VPNDAPIGEGLYVQGIILSPGQRPALTNMSMFLVTPAWE